MAAAASAYQRLLQSYGDQEQAARLARERLESIRGRNAVSRADFPSGAALREILLADGRHVQCFVNVETGLVVVDVVDADERGGVEIFRGIV